MNTDSSRQRSPASTSTWQESFLSQYWEFEPEEAATLGIEGGGTRLRPMSLAAVGKRSEFFKASYAQAVKRLDSLGADAQGHQVNEWLDAACVKRMSAIEVDLYESGESLANPHWALYPYTMLRYEELRHKYQGGEQAFHEIALARSQQLPHFLSGLRDRLLQAKDAGRVVHQFWLGSQIGHEIPAAIQSLSQYDLNAGKALEDYAQWVKEELMPAAPPEYLLGPERYQARLDLSFELNTSLEELVSEATEALETLKAPLIDEVARQYPADGITEFSKARAKLLALQHENPTADTDLSQLYLSHMSRAMDGLMTKGEFQSWEPDSLGFAEYPEGMRDFGAGTNWPAPLLDKTGKGHFVLHPDHAAHSLAWAPVLAIHEGAPGHFLQTEAWQRAFHDCRFPVRFLCIADDVAIPRQNYSAMLNVEGYAVYAEELVRTAGIHQGSGKIFAIAAHMLRAVRVIAEINLHRGTWSAAETANFIESNACLASAKWELERYQRGPIQALSYYVGAREISRLRDQQRASEGSAFDAARFHQQLFSFGPLLPKEIEWAMRAAQRT